MYDQQIQSVEYIDDLTPSRPSRRKTEEPSSQQYSKQAVRNTLPPVLPQKKHPPLKNTLRIKKTKSILESVESVPIQADFIFEEEELPEIQLQSIPESRDQYAAHNNNTFADYDRIARTKRKNENANGTEAASSTGNIPTPSTMARPLLPHTDSIIQISTIEEINLHRDDPMHQTTSTLPPMEDKKPKKQHKPRTISFIKNTRRSKLKAHVIKGILVAISSISSLLLTALCYSFLLTIAAVEGEYHYTYVTPALPANLLRACISVLLTVLFVYAAILLAYLISKFRGGFTCFNKQVLFLMIAITTCCQTSLFFVWHEGLELSLVVYERFKDTSDLEEYPVVKMLFQWRMLSYSNLGITVINGVSIILFAIYRIMEK